MQLLNREQTRLEVVLLPLACFGMADPVQDAAAFAKTHFHVVRVELAASDAWVNVHHTLVWLPAPSTDGRDTVAFLWLSETTGYAHVQLCRSTRLLADAPTEPVHESCVSGVCPGLPVSSRMFLLWSVLH